jgi:hypothetical protein
MTGPEFFERLIPDEKEREKVRQKIIAHLREIGYRGYEEKLKPKSVWNQGDLFYENEGQMERMGHDKQKKT